jgi:hypothetical protein
MNPELEVLESAVDARRNAPNPITHRFEGQSARPSSVQRQAVGQAVLHPWSRTAWCAPTPHPFGPGGPIRMVKRQQHSGSKFSTHFR